MSQTETLKFLYSRHQKIHLFNTRIGKCNFSAQLEQNTHKNSIPLPCRLNYGTSRRDVEIYPLVNSINLFRRASVRSITQQRYCIAANSKMKLTWKVISKAEQADFLSLSAMLLVLTCNIIYETTKYFVAFPQEIKYSLASISFRTEWCP